MRKMLISLVRRTARRVRLRRMSEAAVVAATSCGFALAALQLSLSAHLLGSWVAWSSATAWMVTGLLALLGLRGPSRAGLMPLASAWAGVFFVAAGLLASWILLGAPWMGERAAQGMARAVELGRIGRVAPPLAGIALAGIAGAFAAALRGVSLEQAALLLDSRCSLEERVSTAVEAARSDRPETSLAETLYQQAVQAIQDTDVRRIPARRLGLSAVWAFALAVSLAVVSAFLPEVWPDSSDVAVLGTRSLRARAAGPELAGVLRAMAESSDYPRKARAAAAEAARALRARSPDQIDAALGRLEVSLLDLNESQRGRVLSELSAAAEGAGESAETEPARSDGGTIATRPTPPGFSGPVRVYDPLYREARNRDHGDKAIEPVRSRAGDSTPTLDAVWARARGRAGQGARREVPPEYRGILRRYFGTER